MFQEDAQALAAAEKASEIQSGDYEAIITGATVQQPRQGQAGAGSFVITWAIAEGDFEGCEYKQYLTLSPNAAGVRAAFYRNIGYVRPEDGAVDENDFIGKAGKVNLVNNDGSVKVNRVAKSERSEEATEGTDNGDFGL
jgi:hypothetical protein